MRKKNWLYFILFLLSVVLIIFIVNLNKVNNIPVKTNDTKDCIGEWQEISTMPTAPGAKETKCCPGLKIKTSCIGPNGDINYQCYGFDVGICSK